MNQLYLLCTCHYWYRKLHRKFHCCIHLNAEPKHWFIIQANPREFISLLIHYYDKCNLLPIKLNSLPTLHNRKHILSKVVQFQHLVAQKIKNKNGEKYNQETFLQFELSPDSRIFLPSQCLFQNPQMSPDCLHYKQPDLFNFNYLKCFFVHSKFVLSMLSTEGAKQQL